MKSFLSIVAIAFLLVVLVNCSPKTSKSVSTGTSSSSSTSSSSTSTTSSTKSEVYKPSSSAKLTMDEVSALKTEYSDFGPDQLAKGQTIYESSCKKCHKLHDPSSRDAEQWMNIMRKMGPKAKLDMDHYKFVSAYLVSKAK